MQHCKKISFFLLLACLALPCPAQKSKTTWDAATLEKANTAKNDTALNDEEKKVILYMNLVRLDPRAFAATELKHYIDSTRVKDANTRSLLRTLSGLSPMDPLLPSEELNEFAKAHATRFGKENKVGHGNYRERIKNLIGHYNNAMAENCDYGNDKAFDIVMSLLIDEDIKDLTHRKNILNPAYRKAGVSIQPHRGYTWNCVMDFGG